MAKKILSWIYRIFLNSTKIFSQAKINNISIKSPKTKVIATFGSLALLASACGSANASSTSSSVASKSRTLQFAFTADTQPPDPDIFYAGQGLNITMATYQGLVKYASNTPKAKIIPNLATSWTISPGGRTYTFHLRPNVKFHDGTTFTSTSVAVSFARRQKLNQGPAYMLSQVSSVSTPSPLVAVVHLKTPVAAFMDYLASAYGPKMESPTALAKHSGNDLAQSYLRTHDIGTGPYQISKVVPGQKYVLTRFNGYWGPKPYYKTINIFITPDVTTQQLQLEQGQLQMILHGLSTSAIQQFRSNRNFKVSELPTLQMAMIWVNPNKGAFKSNKLRLALEQAVNKNALVKEVFPGRGTVAKQIYPKGELPMGTAMENPTYNPAKLTQLVKSLPNSAKSISLGYSTSQPSSQLLANLLQIQLSKLGLKVAIRAIPSSTIYGFASAPATAPNLLIETNWPDAAHPDTWARIVMGAGGGLNYLNCSVPKADSLINKGLATMNKATSLKYYEQAGTLYAASGCWIPIANVDATVITPKWLGGISHQVTTPYVVSLADLKPKVK